MLDGITLNEIDAGRVKRKWIAADIEFYKALCAARLAMAGGVISGNQHRSGTIRKK